MKLLLRIADKIVWEERSSGAPLMKADACRRLLDDLERAREALPAGPLLSAGQRAGLISWVYRAGIGAFLASALRERLAAGDMAGAAIEFGRASGGDFKAL
jgi:GH24 family phage-related lysozyme (muramidase)